MRSAILVLMLLGIASVPADAQRKSRSSGRGVPCGRSYISPDRICHIGAPASPKPDSTPSASGVSPRANLVTAAGAAAVTPTRSVAATSTGPIAVPSQPTYAEFVAPLAEMIGFKVNLKNPPIDDNWLRSATLAEVHSDHLLLAAENRRVRIPLSSIELYYTDPGTPGEITLAFRK
jgi:hypothetical protein